MIRQQRIDCPLCHEDSCMMTTTEKEILNAVEMECIHANCDFKHKFTIMIEVIE